MEDDCVPHPDFFLYCATLLERYRHDSRVWCVSGTNFQDGQWRGDGSYYLSATTIVGGGLVGVVVGNILMLTSVNGLLFVTLDFLDPYLKTHWSVSIGAEFGSACFTRESQTAGLTVGHLLVSSTEVSQPCQTAALYAT